VLESSVRPADTVARLGGDEFVVLMEDVEGHRDVVTVAERLLLALREPVVWGDERFTVGGSVASPSPTRPTAAACTTCCATRPGDVRGQVQRQGQGAGLRAGDA
jgi:GGDEF domain-containing protein